MATLLILLASVVLSSLVGYLVHRAIHQEWSGPLHRGHMEHHLELYPPTRLTSESYQVAKWYHSGPVLFAPAAALLLVAVAAPAWLLGTSWWNIACFAAGLIAFGLLNDQVHDAFHLRSHWLQKVPYFRRLRRLHFLHHVDMTRNFGIVVMAWDDVFKTKKDT